MEKDSALWGWVELAMWVAGGVLALGLISVAGYCAATTSDVGRCVRGLSFRLMSMGLHFAMFGYGLAGAKIASKYTTRSWLIGVSFFAGMLAWGCALLALGFPTPFGGDG
jgi:hypothetical protein